jgi:hypothetical protein
MRPSHGLTRAGGNARMVHLLLQIRGANSMSGVVALDAASPSRRGLLCLQFTELAASKHTSKAVAERCS